MSPKKQRKQNVGPIPKAYRAPQKVLKIEVINKLSGHAEELQGLGRNDEFWKEAAILEATCCRSWNQYRGTEYFERVKEVWRLIRQLDSLQLRTMVDFLAEQLRGQQFGTFVAVPSQECLAVSMKKVLAGCNLLLVLIDAIERGACPLTGTIAKGYNTPHGLFWLATISRLRVLAASMLDSFIQIYNVLSGAVVYCPNHSPHPKSSFLLSLPVGLCKQVDGAVTYLKLLDSPTWTDKLNEAKESLQLMGTFHQDQGKEDKHVLRGTGNSHNIVLENNMINQNHFQNVAITRGSKQSLGMNHVHPLAQSSHLGHAQAISASRNLAVASLDSMMRSRKQGSLSKLPIRFESRRSDSVKRKETNSTGRQLLDGNKNTKQETNKDERSLHGRAFWEVQSHPSDMEHSRNLANPLATVVLRTSSGTEADQNTDITGTPAGARGDAEKSEEGRTLETKKRKKRRKKVQANFEETKNWDEWFRTIPP